MSLKPPVRKPIIPLSLEDSCLAWLVIDLEQYTPELLALLPFRLRYRLLANLPVLDLCRLEYTCVAEGIDLESIWETRCSPQDKEGGAISLQQRTANRVKYIDLSSLSWRDRYLHAVATTILSNSLQFRLNFLYQSSSERKGYFRNSENYTIVVDWLISLRGYQFLNEDGDLESSYDWPGLASSFLFFEAEYGNRYDRLTPPRYAPYKSSGVRLPDEELITLLLRNCHFKPKCLLVSFIRSTASELFLQTEACDILKEFLSEVEGMQLYVIQDLPIVLFQSVFCSTSPKLRTLQLVIRHTYSSGISEQEEFQKSILRMLADVIKQQFLETIYLGMTNDLFPGLRDRVLASPEFMALTASLTSFVACPQFHTLDISKLQIPLAETTDILCAFLVSPCCHQQTLKLPHRLHPSSKLDPVAHCSAGPMPVPDLGLEYKGLYLQFRPFRSVEPYIQLCKTLFAFPRIRLRSLEVDCFQTITHDQHQHIDVLHMAAQHPDIQVKTLRIWLRSGRDIPKLVLTLHDDMRALLQIPTLTNLYLPSRPINDVNPGNIFLSILAQELPKRHHLAAIEELDLGRSNFLELPAEEIEILFQSIFSLPRLSQLTLNLMCSVVSLQHYKLIHRLWTEHSSGERLKKLVVGSDVLMSEKDYADGSSVTGIMSLLDSMAQSTDVVERYGQTTGVKTDLIRAELKISK